MPYKIVEDNGKYCLEKEDTGERVAGSCHDTRAETEAMMSAMYAHEKKESEAEKALFERIWDAIQERLGIGAKDIEQTGFKVVGNHWLTVWSNNFEDRDGETFTAKAIDEYVTRVDAGIIDAPELWVWHAGKATAIGQAAWVGRHGHFLLAGGEFYGAPQAQTAKAYFTKHAKDTRVSHGFTYPQDKLVDKQYHQFNTFEISLLPKGVEANLYTSLEGVKEMALSETKKKFLEDVFKEHAPEILTALDERGKAIEALGIEYKDFTASEAEQNATAQREATENATKALGDLVTGLVEDTSTAIKSVTEALQAVKAVDAAQSALESDTSAQLAAMRKDIDDLRAEMDLRPRSASKAVETEVDASHLSPEIQKTLREQNTVRDSFWNLDIEKT